MKKGLLALLGAMLLVPSLVFADGEKKVDFYGMAQYRLRYQMMSTTYDDTDNNTSVNNYSNKLAYNFGAKVKVNEQVSMQVEMGNMHIATETVTLGSNTSMFHLAYATWAQEKLNLTFGLQPVKGTPTLDLLDRSMTNGTYDKAWDYTWAVWQTNSMAGLKVGAPVIAGDTKLAVNLFTSVLEERTVAQGTDDTRVSNPSKIFWYLDAPFSQGPLSISPNLAVIMNRNVRDDVLIDDGSDMELAYGFSAGYKLSDAVSFSLGVGMAGYSNANTAADSSDSAGTIIAVPDAAYEYAGMNLSAGTAIKTGTGTVKLTFYYNSAEDKEVDGSKTGYTYVDLKYGYSAYKNLTIMPRVRLYMTSYNADNSVLDSAMEIRPELIFIGKF